MLFFKTLSLTDHLEISSFVNKFKPYSDFNFLSLYSWSSNSQIKYSFSENALFLMLPDYITQKMVFTFLPKNKIGKELEKILNWLEANSLELELNLLPDFILPHLEKYLNKNSYRYTITPDRNSYDYILSTSKVAAASGKEYSEMRAKLNKYETNWGNKVKRVNFDPKNLEDIKKASSLANQWAEQKRAKNESYEEELYAFNRFLFAAQYYDNLRYSAFEIEGKLIGLASAEILNNGYAVGHFLKSDLLISGTYHKLVKTMCEELYYEGIEYLNIEQDLGISGLREAKLKLRPVNFLKKFSLKVDV